MVSTIGAAVIARRSAPAERGTGSAEKKKPAEAGKGECRRNKLLLQPTLRIRLAEGTMSHPSQFRGAAAISHRAGAWLRDAQRRAAG